MTPREFRKHLDRLDLSQAAFGRLVEVDTRTDPNFGSPKDCYVCGIEHSAYGIVRIEGSSVVNFPICEPCLAADKSSKNAMRKFIHAADVAFVEGGEATTEQIHAMADKLATTEH